MWKDIPEQHEQQFSIQNSLSLNADAICSKLQQNNVMTVARRSVEGQELLYHSIKYTNNIFVLSELKIHQGSSALTLSLKSRHVQAIANMNEMYQIILNN
uniref:B2-adapt-app_C domain-containing protein n=1 Tax=Heterorhabditis bacteriophora TaxID=37862 RepID=A0A1I7XSW9_HETBA